MSPQHLLTFATKKLSTGEQGRCGFLLFPRSFDSDERPESRETRVRTLRWASSGHIPDRSLPRSSRPTKMATDSHGTARATATVEIEMFVHIASKDSENNLSE